MPVVWPWSAAAFWRLVALIAFAIAHEGAKSIPGGLSRSLALAITKAAEVVAFVWLLYGDAKRMNRAPAWLLLCCGLGLTLGPAQSALAGMSVAVLLMRRLVIAASDHGYLRSRSTPYLTQSPISSLRVPGPATSNERPSILRRIRRPIVGLGAASAAFFSSPTSIVAFVPTAAFGVELAVERPWKYVPWTLDADVQRYPASASVATRFWLLGRRTDEAIYSAFGPSGDIFDQVAAEPNRHRAQREASIQEFLASQKRGQITATAPASERQTVDEASRLPPRYSLDQDVPASELQPVDPYQEALDFSTRKAPWFAALSACWIWAISKLCAIATAKVWAAAWRTART